MRGQPEEYIRRQSSATRGALMLKTGASLAKTSMKLGLRVLSPVLFKQLYAINMLNFFYLTSRRMFRGFLCVLFFYNTLTQFHEVGNISFSSEKYNNLKSFTKLIRSAKNP